MSLTLTTYPTNTNTLTGQVNNIFAGFDTVELEYKREDISIISIEQGVDNNILVNFSQSISNLGDYLYIYSVGTAVTYNGSYKILDYTDTTATLDLQFAGGTNGGYCNYKENYFVEYKLVNPTNNDILIYPVMLTSSGTTEGVIKLNVSAVVDFLKQEIGTESQELTNGRVTLQVMYREVWQDHESNTFKLENLTPIVIVYSAEITEVESFITGFDEPKIYEGYPFTLRFLHTLENLTSGNQISVYFDELDINKDILTSDNILKHFKLTEYGQLEVNFNDKSITINPLTEFITFKIDEHTAVDYATVDYNDTGYLTINS